MKKWLSRLVSRDFKALVYSYRGLIAVCRTSSAFRQELALGLLLLPIFSLCDLTRGESLLLLGSWVLVLIFELLNSAIESVVDPIGREHHVLSGQAKDLGSAAVFLSFAKISGTT